MLAHLTPELTAEVVAWLAMSFAAGAAAVWGWLRRRA